MPIHPFTQPRGRLEVIEVGSPRLANVLGDPLTRSIAVYLPDGYDRTDRRYPVLVDLAAFTNSGLKRSGWRAFEESLPQRVDRLVAAGVMPPVIVVMPDAFTSLGGNQYVDSEAMGQWGTFVAHDVVDAVDAAFRTVPERAGRAVFGKSSGGFAALIHGMRYADRWGAIGCHSGDVGFDWCYLPGFPDVCVALAAHGGDPAAYLDALRVAPRMRGADFHVLMLLAMAATYDPDPEARYGVRLPVDPRTCEVIPERWRAWLAWDPLTVLEQPGSVASLRSLAAVYIDCGDRDQYQMQFGARRLARRLDTLGVPHRYDEFSGTHSGVDHRLDVSLPLLACAVSP